MPLYKHNDNSFGTSGKESFNYLGELHNEIDSLKNIT